MHLIIKTNMLGIWRVCCCCVVTCMLAFPGGHADTMPMPSTDFNTDYWTTNYGSPVDSNNHSITLGRRGPILMEDYHNMEKQAIFNRERIPERVVHARGTTAKGYFEVTRSLSDLTAADFLQRVGEQTPVLVRFSIVIPSKGGPETTRDVRGFAVKFYTKEGNFDLAGNNIPVFFIRDGKQFPDLIHALKPNPKNNLIEQWRRVDYFSHRPESLHMFTYLMDDIGIPQDYRHMDGAGVNTFVLLTGDSKATYCKFHWKSKQGVKNLLDEDAAMLAGKDDSHATRDLYEAIQNKTYPEWTLHVQTMSVENEYDYEFDPLDDTKIWPEDRFPLREVGKMVLNQNIDNFFNENEQVAFHVAITPPGIALSDDKMLQARAFAYADANRYRVGSNYLLLPANAPKNPHFNNHHDGLMNFLKRDEEVNYSPSRVMPIKDAKSVPMFRKVYNATREQATLDKENNYQQPGDRWRSFDADRQGRFVVRISNMLLAPRVDPTSRDIWLNHWSQVDEDLGRRIREKLEM